MNEQLQITQNVPDKPSVADLDEDFSMPSARGNRKVTMPITVEVIRELTRDDLPALVSPPPVAADGQRLVALRHSHHQLAQLLAKGMEHGTVSLMTGYSMSYISIMMADPSFRELLDYYSGIRELVFVDVLERMKILGLTTLDEIQERLTTEPDKWANRELMELAETLLKAHGGAGLGNGAGNTASPVTVNVKFVSSKTPQADNVIEGEVIEG